MRVQMRQDEMEIDGRDDGQAGAIQVAIYVAPHCNNCRYAYIIADQIRSEFPQVNLRIVDLSEPNEPIPESVFATPTYLLNDRVWSLGNPSHQQVRDTLGELTE